MHQGLGGLFRLNETLDVYFRERAEIGLIVSRCSSTEPREGRK